MRHHWKDESSNLTRTLRAPSDVTRVAGANAYAAKLAASPTPTRTRVAHHKSVYTYWIEVRQIFATHCHKIQQILTVATVSYSVAENDVVQHRFDYPILTVQHNFSSYILHLLLPPFYGHYRGQPVLAGIRTGGFCWNKVLMPTCPCWWQLAYSD